MYLPCTGHVDPVRLAGYAGAEIESDPDIAIVWPTMATVRYFGEYLSWLM